MIVLTGAAAISATLTPASGHAQRVPADIDHQIASTTSQLESTVEEFNAVREDLASTRARLALVDARLRRLTAASRASRARVSSIAAWAYRTGVAGQASAALAADNPASFMDRVVGLLTLTDLRDREVGELIAAERELRRQQARLSATLSRDRTQQEQLTTLRAQVTQRLDALRRTRARASRSERMAVEPTRALPAIADPPTIPRATAAVTFSRAQLGKSYQWGAAGPSRYDCSGLAMAAWQAGGVLLPHNALRQYQSIPHISRSALRPGDLVFYYSDVHHVAVYLGSGQVIHAPGPGERVTIAPVALAPIHGYGRPR